ncbi:unnamed protein product [Mytilus coruscus]|uniref:Uncharacterized protein n=1 Tax=Mytilus coruscus TaxID=42192 RepID=A0A6J8C8Z5_MYTCO|nr:unnamed protein product [Mytilus coruscus]
MAIKKRAHVVKAKDPIGFPTDPVLIPKDPVVLPSNRLPECNVGCTLQIIPPECVQETFGFEHGVRCRGCDIDICNRGRGDNLDRWQGGSQWQDGRSIQNRNRRIGDGFVDSLGSDFLNGGQHSNLGGRFRNRLDTNFDRRNRFETNRQGGNEWL